MSSILCIFEFHGAYLSFHIHIGSFIYFLSYRLSVKGLRHNLNY